jgi:AsmA protein
MSTPVKILLGLAGLVLILFLALVITVTVIFEPEDYRGYIVDAVEENTGRSFELEGELGLSVFPCCSVALGPARLGNPRGFPDDRFASITAASVSVKLWPLLVRREVEIGTVTLDGAAVNLVRLADGRVNWELGGAAEAPAAAESAPDLTRLSVEGIRLRDGTIRYADQQAGTSYSIADLALRTGPIDYGTGMATSFPLEGALTFTDDADGTRARLEIDAELSLDGDRLTAERPSLVIVATGAVVPGGEVEVDVSAETLGVLLGEATEISVGALTMTVTALDSRMSLTANGGASIAEGAATPEAELDGDFTLEETSPREMLAALTADPYRPVDESALTRLAATGRWSVRGSTVSVTDLDVRLDDSRLTGTAAAEELGGGGVRFELAVDGVDVDRYLEDRDLEPAATGERRDLARTPSASGELRSPGTAPARAEAAPTEVDVEGAVRVGSLRVSGIELADIEVGLASRGGRASVTLAASGLNGRITAKGTGATGGDDVRLAGTMNVDGISPRLLLEALDAAPETADPEVLASLSGTAGWVVTPRSAAVDDMRWRLDDTSITGSARIDDFDAMATRFDLALDRMDVDAYLAPDDAQAAESEEETEIPVDLIRGLNLSGRLRAGELSMLDMTLREVLAEVQAADGVLRLDPLTADLYGGRYSGRIVIDAAGPKANLTLDQKLEAVQVSEVLQSFFDSDLLAGSLSLELSGSGSGNTPADLLRALAGEVSFDLSDGVYRGMDVLHEVRRARALLKSEAAPEEPAAKETPIRSLAARGRMENGVLQTSQLTADTSGLTLTGRGGVNLVELALDYELDARFTEAAAAAAKLGDLANATIPLTISGPLSSPRVGVDLKGMVTSTLRGTVEQRARDALLDRLGGGAREPAPEAAGAPEAPEPAEPAQERPAEQETQEDEPSTRDLLKRGLRDLLKPPPKPAEEEPD